MTSNIVWRFFLSGPVGLRARTIFEKEYVIYSWNADFSPTTEQHVFSLACSHYNPEIEMNSYIVFQYRLNSVVGNLRFWTNTQKKLYSKASQVELEGRWGLRETGSVSRPENYSL